MKKWLKDLEVIVDKLIPYLIFLLLIIIIIDLFYHEVAEKYKFEIGLVDGFIILVFLFDLIYKYNRVRNLPTFIKKYWLEILAVLPFYLIFRAVELTIGFLEISGLIKQSQNILHTGLEFEKEIALISKEAKEIEEIGARTKAFSRTFKSISRTPRFIAAASFYEKPKLLNDQENILKDVSKKTKKITLKTERKIKKLYKK